jgi:sRNA-binding protein
VSETRRRLTFADLKFKTQPPPPPPPAPEPEATPEPETEPRPVPGALRRAREAIETLKAWKQLYPEAFSLPVPLKVGVHEDLVAAGHEKHVVGNALRYWATSPAYLHSLKRGGPRIALDGTPCGEVEADERLVARTKLDTIKRRPKAAPATPPA